VGYFFFFLVHKARNETIMGSRDFHAERARMYMRKARHHAARAAFGASECEHCAEPVPQYDSAESAARDFRKVSLHAMSSDEFRTRIGRAYDAGDFSTVAHLAARQPAFWNADDLGGPFLRFGNGTESIKRMIASMGPV